MKTLYRVNFVTYPSMQHRDFYVLAENFCQLGKKIEHIEKEHIVRFIELSKVGTEMDSVHPELEIWNLV